MEKSVLSKTTKYVKLFYHITCQSCHIFGLLNAILWFPKSCTFFSILNGNGYHHVLSHFCIFLQRFSCFPNTLTLRKYCSEKSVSDMTWFSASHSTWKRCHSRVVLLQFSQILLQFNMSQSFMLFILHLFQHLTKWGALDSITASSIILKAKSYQCWNSLSTSSL